MASSILVALDLPLALSSSTPPDGLWAGAVLEVRQRPKVPIGWSSIPIVLGLDSDVFRTGEWLDVDGGSGNVELEGVQEVKVVTSFLENLRGQVLLLRRSDKVGTFRGQWAGVSGFLEEPTPESQARKEIREETGYFSDDITLEARGSPVYARDGHRIFVVYPFRFRVRHERIRLDWEHTEYEWVEPEAIRRRPTVPKLGRVWDAVSPSV